MDRETTLALHRLLLEPKKPYVIKTRKSCDKTCGLCGGCDLIKALGLNTADLNNYGVDVKECRTFCSQGVRGCIKKCKAAEDDCKYCGSC